jgi:4-carboxymuconolactone decarboxylase
MDNLFETGLAKRKETLGADYVDNTLANADAFSRPFSGGDDSLVLGIWLG